MSYKSAFGEVRAYLDGKSRGMENWQKFNPGYEGLSLDNEIKMSPYHKRILQEAYSDKEFGSVPSYYISSAIAHEVDEKKADALAMIAQHKAMQYAEREFDEIIYAPLPEGVLAQTVLQKTPEGDKYVLTINYELVSKSDEVLSEFNEEGIYEVIAHEAGHLVGLEKENEAIRKYNPNSFERSILRALHEGMNSKYTSVDGSNIEPYAIYQQMVGEIEEGDISNVLNKYFAVAEVNIDGQKHIILSLSREAIEAEVEYLRFLSPEIQYNYIDVTKYVSPSVIEEAFSEMKGAYEEKVASKEATVPAH